MRPAHSIRSCQPFPAVIPVHPASSLRVTHPSAMVATAQAPLPHRLACVKHSVSVHPEPGSNSSFNIIFHLIVPWRGLLLSLDFYFLIYHSAFLLLFPLSFRRPFPNRRNILYQKKFPLSTLFFEFFYFFVPCFFNVFFPGFFYFGIFLLHLLVL